MDFRYLNFMVTLVCVYSIWGLPLAPTTCPHNGTSYREGEAVRTEEPCLSCVCQRGSLECSLRVCADHPSVPHPGCFFVHKPNDCCPQLFCEEESFNPIEIELRVSFNSENKLNASECFINGSIYAEGSAVASSEPCEYCYCVEGEMKCIKPRCLRSFEGCEAIHEKFSCCPTHYDCRNADTSLLRTHKENFVSASSDPKNSFASSRTPWTLELTPEDAEKYLNGRKSPESSAEETRKAEEELGWKETEEANTERTTAEGEDEATTPWTEVQPTSDGFQTTKTDYFVEGPTAVGSTEETTLVPETTSHPPSPGEEERRESWKFDYSESMGSSEGPKDGSGNGSSQEVEDYEDSYDYEEPQLPPSLPNLVIFPFVAADAVIKDETTEALKDQVEIKRIDAHPVFYKDFFSPPEKTEGGFLPKEPSKSSESFFEVSYFGKRQSESTAATGLKKEKQWPKVPFTDRVVGETKNATPASREEEAFGQAETPPDYTLHRSQQTKKPVTVTYKNVVVDFYPNYLITTTRAHTKAQPPEHSVGGIRPPVHESFPHSLPKIKNHLAPPNTTGDPLPDFLDNPLPPSKKTRETPEEEAFSEAKATTTGSSFFDEFFTPFVGEETPMTTTTTSFKQKYSSKIKNQAKSEFDKALVSSVCHTLKKPEVSTAAASASFPSPVTDKTKIYSATRKQIIKEGPQSFRKSSFPHLAGETSRGTEDLLQSVTKKRRQEAGSQVSAEEGGSRSDSSRLEGGSLLKLAGCNIYGMMYRVGKVITELSGPCLECLCTDLGVQCRALDC